MPDSISFKLNSKPVDLNIDGDRLLLWVLRTELGLTGAKYGCGEGHCGACVVLVDNVAVRSCLTRVKEVAGKEIVTIEGLADGNTLHPIQSAFLKHDALQCGFCTPGMILSAYSLLKTNFRPTREEVARRLEHNYCRCGAHPRILDAVQTAAAEMKGEI